MKNIRFAIFWILVFAVELFAASPFEIFKNNFYREATNYVIPILIFVIIVATAITYTRTKDWTISLVVGGVAAGIIGGAAYLSDQFINFDLNATP